MKAYFARNNSWAICQVMSYSILKDNCEIVRKLKEETALAFRPALQKCRGMRTKLTENN